MSRSTNWLFTINNPRNETIPEQWTNDVKYCMWQAETGENGTPHLQGYLQLKKRSSLGTLKKLDATAHWEIRRGTHQQAVEYCSKEQTRTSGPFTYGQPTKGPGQRNDLTALKEALDEGRTEKDIAMDDQLFPVWAKYYRALERYNKLAGKKVRTWPTQTTVYWGPPGTGKSSRALHEGGTDAFWLPKPHSRGAVWWDGYDGQETVVIDEFYGWIQRDLMCRLCDRYPLFVETKGGSVPFLAKKIIITSNKPPSDWWSSIGLGAMQRRLESPLGSVHEIKTFTPPDQPLQVDPVLCVMCNDVQVSDHGQLCKDCYPTLTELYSDSPMPQEEELVPDSPHSFFQTFRAHRENLEGSTQYLDHATV